MSNKHPIRDYLDDVSAGWEPAPAEIDQVAQRVIDGIEEPRLDFATLRKQLREATDKITAHRAEGLFGQGRTTARETALELIGQIGEYVPTREDPHADEMDPRRLAAMAAGESRSEDHDDDLPARVPFGF